MTYILMTKGLKQSVCDQSFYNGPVSKFWAYAFVLSKAPELGKFRPFYGLMSHIARVLGFIYCFPFNHCTEVMFHSELIVILL